MSIIRHYLDRNRRRIDRVDLLVGWAVFAVIVTAAVILGS